MEEVGRILPRVFAGRAAKREAPLAELLVPLWRRVAGPAIAAQSRPEAFEGGTLTLAVSSAAWAVTLKRMSEELRAAVNRYFGSPAVKKLRIVVTAGNASGQPGAPRAATYEVRDETVARLERTMARISAFPKD